MKKNKKKEKPKILCYLNHYYNNNGVFDGKSANTGASERKEIVQRALDALNDIENCSVKVCGIEGNSLVDLDITFNSLEDSRMLIFESILEMSKHIGEYDYFINIEDDILITKSVLENIYEFDEVSTLSEILLPNRLERNKGNLYCIDTQVFPGWINTEKIFKNKLIKVAINPHSGLLIFSKEKFQYSIKNTNGSKLKTVCGGGKMAAAFAYFHKPFSLYRSKDDLNFHSVFHMDKWAPKNNTLRNRLKISNLKRLLNVLPMRLKFHIEDII